MPQKPPRPCSYPGCINLTRSGAYCPEHTKEIKGAYEKQRGAPSKRGYGTRWKKLRKIYLSMQPLCEDPFGLHKDKNEIVEATDVDHIIPLRQGGANSIDNLQALCHSCHSRKTAKEDHGFGR